jgi:glycosyltransferase involved in cell wall biosynthesis
MPWQAANASMLAGRRDPLAPEQRAEDFRPLQIEQVELTSRLPAIRPRTDPAGVGYSRARVLVRVHTYPIGIVEVPLPPAGLEPAALAAAVEAQLAPELRAHLTADGLEPPASLAAGTGGGAEPPCQAERRAVLADPPAISVVVPTRGRPEILLRCLASILACEYPAGRRELIVADNAPSDSRTREAVESSYRDDEAVRYVLAPRPGSASARNDGIAAASGEIVACTDDDIVVDAHWLAELARGFASPDVACVTGLIMGAEFDTPAQALLERYGGYGKGYQRRRFDLSRHRPREPLFPFNPGVVGSGSNVAFRRPELMTTGVYDPELGNGTPTRSGEDLELFLRLMRQGRTIAYEPGAIAWHAHHRDLADLQRQIYDYGVGIGALLTRTIVREPSALGEIAVRLPRGLWYLFAASSPPNRDRGPAYPRSLRLAELRGLLRGPAAYLRSRRDSRRATGL